VLSNISLVVLKVYLWGILIIVCFMLCDTDSLFGDGVQGEDTI
jgi:hypothetical protein